MARIQMLAIALSLLLGGPFFAPAAGAADPQTGQEDDWGFDDRDDWQLGDETVREDYGWDDGWGQDDTWGEDSFGRYDGDFDWNVDDPGFEEWYGESDDWFDFDFG